MAEINALGTTLLHSLWQATLLAGLLWAASRYGRLSARTRYGLAYSTLLLQLFASILTYLHYFRPAPRFESTVKELVIVYVSGGAAAAATNPYRYYTDPTFWMATLVTLWALSLLVGSTKLALSFGRVRRMQTLSEPIARFEAAHGPTGLANYVTTLATRIGFRGRVSLRVGERISSPVLLGHLKPILLLPVAIVNQLSTEEAETVLLHELAHLRRHDHLFNLLQCLIEVLFYYHPAIHWIGARIREEREYCCDDLVLTYGPGRLPYARALLHYSEQAGATPATVLSLTDGGGLLLRVRRFINNHQITYTMNRNLLSLPLLALIALITTAAYTPLKESTLAEDEPVPITQQTNPPAAEAAPLMADTLPDGKHEVTKISNGKTTRLKVENGKIQELTIDDEAIPPAEYDDYERTAEALLDGKSDHWDFDFSPYELHALADRTLQSVNVDSIMQELQNAQGRMLMLNPDSLLRIAQSEMQRINMDSLMQLQEQALQEANVELLLLSDSLSRYKVSYLNSVSALERQERQLERQLEYLRERKEELKRQEKTQH